MIRKNLLLLLLSICATAAYGQKKPLDESVYDSWKAVSNSSISRNGEWVIYEVKPQVGDGKICFVNLDDRSKSLEIERAGGARLLCNDTWAVFKYTPAYDSIRAAKLKKIPNDRMPRDTTALINLATGDIKRIGAVKSAAVPEKGSLFFYVNTVTPAKDSTMKKQPEKFDRLVILDLIKGDSLAIDSIKNYISSKDGSMVMFTRERDSMKSVWCYKDKSFRKIYENKSGRIGSISVDEKGTQGSYTATQDTVRHAVYRLFHFSAKDFKSREVAPATDPRMPEGYTVTANAGSFSKEGKMLRFNIAVKPREIPNDTLTADEKYSFDLWSYTDTLIQPQQLAEPMRVRNRSYSAVYYIKDGVWKQMTDNYWSTVQYPNLKDETDFYIITDEAPYAWAQTWDYPTAKDIYRLDVKTGRKELIFAAWTGSVSTSPGRNYIGTYSGKDGAWYTYNTKTGLKRNVSAEIGYPVNDEFFDQPTEPGSYGFGGWAKTTGKKQRDLLCVNDLYDLWALDPEGIEQPRSITNGYGRKYGIQLRLIRLKEGDGEEEDDLYLKLDKDQYFKGVNLKTKEEGFYVCKPFSDPVKLLEAPAMFKFKANAKNAGVLIWSRESFGEYPDLWASDMRFGNARRISDANPQMKDYKWGSVELITWSGFNGEEQKGLLYLPENYDKSKRYPVVCYFYETHTENMFSHYAPQPSWSIINPAMYVSNGYVVFMPDIRYRDGYPGQSAYNSIVSGAQALIERGIADRERIGLNGQSWGGYQTAYLITQTDMFKCAVAGAPVANMTSAYGGIRWGKGLSRMFQYEHQQSRIGGTLWEKPMQFIENSPLFYAPKVNTPLVIMSNDNDEAVPWYQGIEYYLALRRLGKQVWMFSYNGESHNLTRRPARKDWSARMLGFYNYYLKGEPMPRWMKEGISVSEKGVDYKLD